MDWTGIASVSSPNHSLAVAASLKPKDRSGYGTDKTEYPAAEPAPWEPTDEEKAVRARVVRCLTDGYTNQYKPRVEFNDASLIQRMTEDLMAFNTYQPNDGEWPDGDVANNWRSTAIRPVERNKVMSVAGHAAGRLGFLKAQATNEDSKPDADAADVMNTLLDWSRSMWLQPEKLLQMMLASLYAPKCFVHWEWRQTYRQRKTEKVGNKWNYEMRMDEDLSGFITTVVPPDQLFLENIFERDIQKQGWLVWRRVQSHDLMEAKYSNWKNFDKVRRGMHFVFNDPNANFYYVYDPNMIRDMAEEIVYWCKDNGGEMITMVNGVVIGEPDAANPREDGMYPFLSFGYQMIRTNFLYDKSLVNSVAQDAKVLNTLYPLVIDTATLATIPPMVATGTEIIGSDVIIPGMTTTFKDVNAQLRPLMQTPPSVAQAMTALTEVEKSLDQTVNIQPFQNLGSNVTAEQIQAMEQQKEEAIGPFRDSLLSASYQMTRLALGDILQHFTAVDADKITADAPLVYRRFLAGTGKGQKRIGFEDMSKAKDGLKESYKTLEMQGGSKAEVPLYRVDPQKFRDLKFMMELNEDVLRPKSENVKFRRNLDTFDRSIQAKTAGANVDLDATFKDFVLANNEKSSRNPDKYFMKAQTGLPNLGQQQGGKPPQMPQPSPVSGAQLPVQG